MNKENTDIINRSLLIGDKFMPEMHLWDPKVKKYSACGPFTRHQKRIDQFMKDGRLSHIAKNKLDAACFQHDSAYNKYKDSVNRRQSDIALKNKALKIAVHPKVNGYQRNLAALVYKFFKGKTKGSGLNIKELAEELHKPIIKNFKRRKVYSSFKDNIWGVDLADMQLLSKYNKGIRYLLCVVDLFSRYAWVIPLKNKKGESIVEGFKKILDDSNRKPNKIWVDHGSEFYNNKFKSFLKKNIEMYSTYNEGKSVVAERFIKTLKNKIYKHMTTIGKNVYFNVLDNIVDKYNNNFRNSIKMKLKDVKDDSFVEYFEESNKTDPKFKVSDNVRISKYKNIFAKGYTPNWSEEVFNVNKVQNTVPWTYLINDLNGEEIKGSFYEKELQKTDQKEFGIEKVIKKKGNKLYVK